MSLITLDNNPINKKDVKYASKDFTQLRDQLIEFAKVYYPDTYNDFSEASTGMMFIEMVAALGDVFSYYIDDTLKEMLLPLSQERKNVIKMAQFFGYKVKPLTPARTTLDIYQLVPSVGSGENNRPDYTYSLVVKAGLEVEASTDSTVRFRTELPVDFSHSSSFDPTTVTVYSRDPNSNEPIFYLLKKQVPATAGTEVTETFTVTDPEQYLTLTIENNKVVEIIDVRDSNNNKYYEVPFLAQDYIYEEYPNTDRYDQVYSAYRANVPYLLRLIKTPRRFVTRVTENNYTEIQFGAGTSSDPDQIIVPNTKNIGIGTTARSLTTPIDPQNFYTTRAYGQAPANTTLTVKYLRGGGLSSNVSSNVLTKIRKMEFESIEDIVSNERAASLANIQQSIAVNNPQPATGGKDSEPIDNIRNSAISFFSAQSRAVTKRDYEIRALSLPSRFGNVAKAFVVPDGDLDLPYETAENLAINHREKNNPFAINLYLLGYDKNKKLTLINDAVKHNLKTYLSEYRMVTDGINILDGFIVNIGVDFVITTFSSYNKNEVLVNAVEAVKDFFNIDNWTFNQPINISDIELRIASVAGVSSVQDITIKNLVGGNYANFAYNISSARRVISNTDTSRKLGKIIYPSLDPMIFEVKYPNNDIRGRVL